MGKQFQAGISPSQGDVRELASAEALAERLIAEHGELVTGPLLAKLLGYPTLSAFRQSLLREQVPIPVFTQKGRRGKFALTLDVATWLHRCRTDAMTRRSKTVAAIESS